MAAQIRDDELIREYTPVLVLHPEIPSGSSRKENPNYPHVSLLSHDYHPRDIRMVLENASFLNRRFWPGKVITYDWQEMLKRIERAGYKKDLDVLPKVSRKDREGFWEAYAGIDKRKYPRACYARVVRGEGINADRLVVQYWYAYFYNDFWNTHEMDWEVVMLIFKVTEDGAPLPRVCACSAHHGGTWLPWEEVDTVGPELAPGEPGRHPVVYVASGSHANYFYGPALYTTAPPTIALMARALGPLISKVFPRSELGMQLQHSGRMIDLTTSWEEGSPQLVNARPIPAPGADGAWMGEWAWLNQKARWGSPGQLLALGGSGPRGPRWAGSKWHDPLTWVVAECTRAPSRQVVSIPSRI